MDYAAERGIPFKEFLAWDEGDQEVALVWLAQKRGVHRCGTHPDEWNEERGGDPDAYVAEVQVCPGCQRFDIAQADLEKAKKSEGLFGAYVALKRNPDLI